MTWDDELPLDVDLLVVGGGYSGLATTMMVTAERPGTRIAIVERSPLAAPGIAFGACEPSHLLNVPSERMGAFPDDPARSRRRAAPRRALGVNRGARAARAGESGRAGADERAARSVVSEPT